MTGACTEPIYYQGLMTWVEKSINDYCNPNWYFQWQIANTPVFNLILIDIVGKVQLVQRLKYTLNSTLQWCWNSQICSREIVHLTDFAMSIDLVASDFVRALL